MLQSGLMASVDGILDTLKNAVALYQIFGFSSSKPPLNPPSPPPPPPPLVPAFSAKAPPVLVPSDHVAGRGDQAENRAVVIDLTTGEIIYDQYGNGGQAFGPASMTKLMVGLLTIEEMKKGNLRPDEIVPISASANDHENSFKLLSGENLTAEQCLYIAAVQSKNNLAYALGERIGGNTEKFVNMMNERARQLGMNDTHFTNPAGFTDPKHYTTAKDLAKLISYMRTTYPEEYKKYFGQDFYLLETSERKQKLENTSPLIGHQFAAGKTGTANGCGACFIGENSSRNLIVLVTGMGDRNAKALNALRVAEKISAKDNRIAQNYSLNSPNLPPTSLPALG